MEALSAEICMMKIQQLKLVSSNVYQNFQFNS